jgi:hypothetical protein
MVALNEITSATKPGGKCRGGGISAKSVDLFPAFLGRTLRSSSAAGIQKSAVSLCRCGENRFLPVGRCSLPSRVRMTLDPVTGLYYARNRNYSPSLGRVLRQELESLFSEGAAYREINQGPAGIPAQRRNLGLRPRRDFAGSKKQILQANAAGSRSTSTTPTGISLRCVIRWIGQILRHWAKGWRVRR